MNNIYKTRESNHNIDKPILFVKIRNYLAGMFEFSDLNWYFQVECSTSVRTYLSSLGF
jgi:hypothetical protein